MLSLKKIRVRIAPSPTGALHIGTARTALFNYLFAKQKKGRLILRIEDTDKKRSEKRWEQDIIENLRWLGIKWDEGPFRQSERTGIYRKYIKKLLDEGRIYYCFCSKQELESQRKEQRDRGEAPRYLGKCRRLSLQQIKENLRNKIPYILRLKTPQKILVFNDLIRGEIKIETSILGDFAVARSLEAPLYNLACIIDDLEMKISHIIRGEDHISNTPKQILLAEALGAKVIPQYAHLPLILAPDRSKLSKRHGAVSVEDFRRQGYLREALINFIALLGWNPGTDKEIFSLSELIKEFSLEKIQKSGAVFNQEKLDWFNGFYIRKKSLAEITEMCLPYLTEAGFIISEGNKKYRVGETSEKITFEDLEKMVSLYQERLKKLSEITQLIDFFFKEKLDYKKELLKWKGMDDKEILAVFDSLKKILQEIKEKEWNKENLQRILLPLSRDLGKGDRGRVLWPFRAALCGKKASAGPFEIAEVLGKKKTIQRIERAKEILLSF